MSRFIVMAGLDPANHRGNVLGQMAGSSPAMTHCALSGMTNWMIQVTTKRKTD